MKRTSVYRKLGAATLAVGGLAALGAPALAATSQSQSTAVTYSATTGCTTCRTLYLYDTRGNSLSKLDLSPGAASFIADVKDQGVDPAAVGNFTVQATMTNLYKVTGSTYDCSTYIPSADVSFQSLPSLLDANSLGAVLQPVYGISGTLPTSLLTPLGLTGLNSSPAFSETGLATTLDQAQVTGGNLATDLLGTILDNGSLPVNLTGAAGGAFTNPDDPSSLGCSLPSGAPAATPQPVMQGALNGIPATSGGSLTGPLATALDSVLNPSSLASVIGTGSGQVDPTQAMDDIAYYTHIPLADLSPTGPYPQLLSEIETDLTASISGVVNSATTLTGTYGANPHMDIKQTGASQGSYQGVLTVTMTQG